MQEIVVPKRVALVAAVVLVGLVVAILVDGLGSLGSHHSDVGIRIGQVTQAPSDSPAPDVSSPDASPLPSVAPEPTATPAPSSTPVAGLGPQRPPTTAPPPVHRSPPPTPRPTPKHSPTPVDLPPTPSLAVFPSTGTAPLTVIADASASWDGDRTPIATYRFDFGDGTAPVSQATSTASHTYPAAGSYTVTVMVSDTGGHARGTSAPVSVSPDNPPTAVLAVNPASGAAPLAVTADASGSTDGDRTPIDTYRFDFGDGVIVGPGATSTASHTYNTAGTYIITVTVVDTAGLSSTASVSVTVT